MAILQQIRKRTVFLIAIIGLALFAFVISGVFKSGTFNSHPSEIGSVNGEEIPISSFRQQVEYATRNFGANATTLQAVNYVWEQNVNSMLLNQQFEKLGIDVGKDEILNVVSENPQIAQNPMFLNEAGVFDKNKFIDYIATLKETNPQAFAQWQMQEANIIEAAKRQVYLGLILAGLSSTKVESEMAYKQESDKANVNFVTLPYSTIDDSTITVDDSEIKAYVSEHQKDFDREASRNVQYVVINEQASDEDKDALKQQLSKLLQPSIEYNSSTGKNDTIAGFRNTKNLQAFVDKNSDIPFDTLYVSKENLPATIADNLYNLSENDLYGPYEDNGYYKITKLVNKKTDGEVQASHILIAYKGSKAANESTTLTKEEAEAKAKQVLAEAKEKDADFAALAGKYSDGPTATRGGDLGFFQKGRMVPEFDKFVFANKSGNIGIVETDFGFHIIKVGEKREVAQFATIARKIEASENTVNVAYTDATKFEMESSDKKDQFSEIAQNMNLTVLRADNLQRNDESIAGLGNNRQLVQWTFNKDTKVGDIKRFNTKTGYVIAQLTKKSEKGLASVKDASPYVKPILIKEKKAALLAEKLKGNNLATIASANNTQVQSVDGLTMKNPVFAGMREPRVVGVAFALDKGKTSNPISGENGVYVIEVTNIEEAPALNDYKSYSTQLRALKSNTALQQIYSSLRESADIEDNRSDFY